MMMQIAGLVRSGRQGVDWVCVVLEKVMRTQLYEGAVITMHGIEILEWSSVMFLERTV